MAGNRKLSKAPDHRKAVLRNQVTQLFVNGKLETTEARAKELRKVAERLITLAMSECDGNITVTKEKVNDKGQTEKFTTRNDTPAKLHVRRQLLAYLFDVKEQKKQGETKSEYKERTKDIRYPVVEKLFNEIAPKYKKLKEENKFGGYTRILKKGPRRGDAAEMVIIELI
ncbi:MAG: 50S ribosomal protein L17 [Eubacteriales bacterium]|nr:50S ribosomal protein L17 [Eubacteriales bacterium]